MINMQQEQASSQQPSAVGTPVFYNKMNRATTYSTIHRAEDLHDHESTRRQMCVIVGSGPSLRTFDFSQLKRPWIYSMAINHEMWRNRDRYTPSMWVFNDPGIMRKHSGYEPCSMCGGLDDIPSDVPILSTKRVVQTGVNLSEWPGKPVPSWVHRVHVYGVEQGNWRPGNSKLFMRSTTATAALCQAINMGFRHIAMLGVDLYASDEDYYYMGGRKNRSRATRVGRINLGNGAYSTDAHMKMMANMRVVANGIRTTKWDGRIFQCSTGSPLSCFEKGSWRHAVNAFKG